MAKKGKSEKYWLLEGIDAIWIVLYGFLSIFFAFQFNSYMKDTQAQLSNFNRNWESPMVESFQIITAPAECPEGLLPEFKFLWPGTKLVCDCEFAPESTVTGLGLKYQISERNCTETEAEKGCVQYEDTDPVSMF